MTATATSSEVLDCHTDMMRRVIQRGGHPSSLEFIDSFLHKQDAAGRAATAIVTRSSLGWDPVSYEQLDFASRQVCTWLQAQGVARGDRVALLGNSGGDWVAAFFGILRSGAVVVPLDPSLTATELEALWARAPWSALLASRRLLGAVQVSPTEPGNVIPALALEDIANSGVPTGRDVPRGMNELALLVWTAGTTGTSKGVCLTFGNLDYVVTSSVAEQEATADDQWLSVLALNHMLELSCGLLACLRSGATMGFPQSQMPHELVAAMKDRGATRMMAVPLLLRLLQPVLAKEPQVAGGLRALYSGGAPLSSGLLECYAAMNVPVYQGYGLTEMSPAVAMNSARHNRPGSVGRPLAGTDVRIENGEILVRSPGLMTGYWADDAATCEVMDRDGWFHTGDLGELDDDGYLYVTGRSKNLVVLESGKKVSAEAVEAALAGSEMFAEVCVVGLPTSVARGGEAEAVCAVIVPSPQLRSRFADDQALTNAVEAEVRRCSAALSGYKRPTHVEIVKDPLPKTVKLSLRRADVLTLVSIRRESR